MKKIIILVLALFTLGALLTGCGDKEQANKNEDGVVVTIGVAPGPYGDMVIKGVKPSLEKKGYKVEIQEFMDYVQPNFGLANKEIDANLFQHSVYLKKFSEDNNLKLSPVLTVPTAGVGIYSNKIKSLEELKDGSEVAIANDPTNLARGLRLLQATGLITINKEIDPVKASERDIAENPKNLKIITLEAAQLPRALDSADLAIINGNFAISAGIPLSSAIVQEQLTEEYKNLVAVRTEDLDKQFVKDIKEIIESDDFRKVIEDEQYMFKDFQKPDWYQK